MPEQHEGAVFFPIPDMPGLPFNKELRNEKLHSNFLEVIVNAEQAQLINLEAVDALFLTEQIRMVGYKFTRVRDAIRMAYWLLFKSRRIEVRIDPTRQTVEFSIWESLNPEPQCYWIQSWWSGDVLNSEKGFIQYADHLPPSRFIKRYMEIPVD